MPWWNDLDGGVMGYHIRTPYSYLAKQGIHFSYFPDNVIFICEKF